MQMTLALLATTFGVGEQRERRAKREESTTWCGGDQDFLKKHQQDEDRKEEKEDELVRASPQDGRVGAFNRYTFLKHFRDYDIQRGVKKSPQVTSLATYLRNVVRLNRNLVFHQWQQITSQDRIRSKTVWFIFSQPIHQT